MRLLISAFLLFSFSQFVYAQPTTYPINGVSDVRSDHYVFTNATIHTGNGVEIENGTLIIKEGKIQQVGSGLSVPKNAVVVDLGGKHIYPSLIEVYSDYGLEAPKAGEWDWSRGPQYVSEKKGAYSWNEAVKPEMNGQDHFVVDKKQAKTLRSAGYGTVLTHINDGIFRGTGLAVNLDESRENEVILLPQASNHMSFNKGSSRQDYPSSLMGTIALIRQTLYDAEWYALGDADETNISLAAFNANKSLPFIFEAKDNLNILRAQKIANEFGLQFAYVGSGEEYQRINEIKGTGSTVIVPVDFPDAYDVEDPFDAEMVTLAEMMHWEMAPTNPQVLHGAGIDFCITAYNLKKQNEVFAGVRKAILHGLDEEVALAALTSTPARLMGIEDKVGTISSGKHANFIITSDKLFAEGCVIHENWIAGNKYVVNAIDKHQLSGTYDLKVGAENYTITIDDSEKMSGKIILEDSTEVKVKVSVDEDIIQLNFDPDSNGLVRLSGLIEGGNNFSGRGQDGEGKWLEWSASLSEKAEEKTEEPNEIEKPVVGSKVLYPFVGYGNASIPQPETVLITNATVWTNEDDGILENCDVLIKNGKIAEIGTDLSSSGAKVIDANGKHVTAGIIDEHSHIAISKGVNEGTQASSAEVSIADVVNSEDVNLYRQLAGGVTGAQLLHGSANPIGGQSGIVKFRWGQVPEQMKNEKAAGFIKFALGENVKQSNWGSNYTSRFPQTRMGVEQVYYNYFTLAREYGETWDAYNSLSSKEKAKTTPPRRDIELDILLEILNKERFITCHSYVQSEINMLMHVADSLDFTLNTFTHILEGFKVADKMKAHGANASTFSDWWAYKYEVIEAIPYNATLLTHVGVNTAINSDDAEMGRRLNQEAAKAVKYGGLDEQEALKLVTLNPAKMLHLDGHTGSIKVGKDADVVVWSDHPLSVYAKAERTYVDGVCYYDMESDKEKRQWIAEERIRLIQKMIAVKNGGGKTQKVKPKEPKLYNCAEGEHHHHCH